jgi:hypothetical protein
MLTAAGVVGDRHHHGGDGACHRLGDRPPQRLEVDVALERMPLGCALRLGTGQVARLRAAGLDVRAGSVEMRVARDHVAGFGNAREQDVLGGASLVGRNHVLEAGDVLHRALETVERRGAGIRLVAGDHRRPLARRHRASAAVGQ